MRGGDGDHAAGTWRGLDTGQGAADNGPMGMLSSFTAWLRGDDERSKSRQPDPDRVVEVAWLPLWQVHLVMPRLIDSGVPATFSEDHTSHLRFAASEPMARIFVMETRFAEAYDIIRDLTGEDPPRQGNPGPPPAFLRRDARDHAQDPSDQSNELDQ